VSLNAAGNIDGVWYSILDLEEGFYIPINEIAPGTLQGVPIGADNPLFTNGKNMVRRLRQLEQINKIILQLIEWLFLNSRMDLKTFIEGYILVDPRKIINSEKYYDVSKVSRRLPSVTSFIEALGYLEEVIPSLVKSGRVLLYSKKYAEGVIYYLKEYIKTIDISKPPTIKYIKVILEQESDYKQFANTVIFTREVDMRTWLISKTKLGIKPDILHRRIDFNDNLVSDPIIYMDPTERTYLIQNVINSDYRRAINVAVEWMRAKVNPGFEAEAYKDKELPHHVIYAITASNIPGPIKDTRPPGETNEKFLEILKYGENRYAAMLPL
jgi:hypothetical protein